MEKVRTFSSVVFEAKFEMASVEETCQEMFSFLLGEPLFFC